jgi:hypothetical protein
MLTLAYDSKWAFNNLDDEVFNVDQNLKPLNITMTQGVA